MKVVARKNRAGIRVGKSTTGGHNGEPLTYIRYEERPIWGQKFRGGLKGNLALLRHAKECMTLLTLLVLHSSTMPHYAHYSIILVPYTKVHSTKALPSQVRPPGQQLDTPCMHARIPWKLCGYFHIFNVKLLKS